MKSLPNSISVRLLGALAVFTFSVLFFAAGIGDRAIVTKGEGREALVAAEMLRSQNFILPLRHGEIPSKPPMFQWMTYVAAQLGGTLDEAAVRLPSVLTASLAAAAAFLFFASQRGLRIATLSTLVLISMFEWVRSAGNARVDMCFTFFLSTAFYLTFLWYEKGVSKKLSSAIILPALLGLAIAGSIVSKGPAGLLVLAISAVLYTFSLRNNPIPLLRLSTGFFAAAVLSVVLAGIWYRQAYLAGGAAFIEVHLWRENIARVVSIPHANVGHEKPFYYAFTHFITSLLPWSLVLPFVGIYLRRNFPNAGQPKERLLLFCCFWILVFLIVVTLSNSKRVVYFLPALPPCAYAIVCALEYVCSGARRLPSSGLATSIRLVSRAFRLAALLVAMAALFFANGTSLLSAGAYEAQLSPLLAILGNPATAGLFVSASILMIAAANSLQRFQPAQFISSASLSTALCAWALNVFVLPQLAELQSVRELARATGEVTEGRRVFKLGERSYPLLFYAQRDIPCIEGLPILPPEEEWFIIAPASEVPDLRQRSPLLEDAYSCKGKTGCGEEDLVLLRYPGNGFLKNGVF